MAQGLILCWSTACSSVQRDCGMVVVEDERFVVPGVAEALRAKHAGMQAA
jgi:hypothetical protein